MSIEIEAIYENGVLKPNAPLHLNEHEVVRVTLQRQASHELESIRLAKEAVLRTSGLIPWTGDPEVLRRIALDDEFGVMEAP